MSEASRRRWRASRRDGHGQEGQATVELALLLPLLLTLLLVVAQVGLVVRSQLLVAHAAREGARAAAVLPDSGVTTGAALRAAGLDPARTEVELRRVGPDGRLVEVTVRMRLAGSVPIVGRFVEGREVVATVRMRVEE